MTKPTLITDWSAKLCPDRPYLAPEMHDHVHLIGIIDGKWKTTSRVVSSSGRTVTTKSGSVYRLGRVSRSYRTWMAERGIEYDPVQPIKPDQRKAAT